MELMSVNHYLVCFNRLKTKGILQKGINCENTMYINTRLLETWNN